MARRDLRSSSLLAADAGSGDDPMSSMGNLMDVMLVFACGLLIALIARYDVDFAPTQNDLGEGEQIDSELTEASWGADSDEGASLYQEMGTVYVDVSTGEMYLVYTDDEDEA
jgi:hypothetical protein